MRNVFEKKKEEILSIFLTAGFPDRQKCVDALLALQACGVDLIELGMPYSDPLADGPVIQEANQIALRGGITIDGYFEIVATVRDQIDCPIVFMGYFNNVFQYGVERFLGQCRETGVDSLIIPDLPPEVYEQTYKSLFDRYTLGVNFLICPTSDDASIRRADRLSHQFVYQVAHSTITGRSIDGSEANSAFLERVNGMSLNHRRLIGFGISDHASFRRACRYSAGGIIGSAFIRRLQENSETGSIRDFISEIRGDVTPAKK